MLNNVYLNKVNDMKRMYDTFKMKINANNTIQMTTIKNGDATSYLVK